MKKTVNFTQNARLDNPDYLRISAFAYEHLREVAFAIFNRVFSEDTFIESEGGFTKNQTILGPQPPSLDDSDTDFLITKESEFAVQNSFRHRNFFVDKKVPTGGGSSKWRFVCGKKPSFYNADTISPVPDVKQNRVYDLSNSDEQIDANKAAHDNDYFSSKAVPEPFLDLSEFVRSVESDVPADELFYVKSIAQHTPTTFETSPFKTVVETFTNHGFKSGEYVKIVGTFDGSSSTWFQGTHRIEKLTDTKFLLYGLPTDTDSTTVTNGPRVFKKRRFQIMGAPSTAWAGDPLTPNDELGDLRGKVSDLEPRKKMKLIKSAAGTTTNTKEVTELIPTRLRGVGYFKVQDLLPHTNNLNFDDRFAPIAHCVGYTDEFQTIRIPKGTRFETIVNEDLGTATDNVLHWQYQYFFPTSLAALGLDANYTVEFEFYDRDGNAPRDRNGTDLIDSIQAIDKTTGGFKIQFVLNTAANHGNSGLEDPEGGRVHQDVFVRFKVSDDYAMPIVLPSFAFDGYRAQDRTFSESSYFAGAEFNIEWAGESLSAANLTIEASGADADAWGNQIIENLNQGATGWDLPLWQKKNINQKRVFFSGTNRPKSAKYDIITEVTTHPTPALEPLSGSSPAAENKSGDNGTFLVRNQTANYFDVVALTLPEPDPSEPVATTTNGQATVKITVREKGVYVRHPIQSFGEQRVSSLKHLVNAGVGDLSWIRKGPGNIVVQCATGASSTSTFKVNVRHLTAPGDFYRVGATDGTFGGMRRQGSGFIPMLSAARTQLTAIQDAEKKTGATLVTIPPLEGNPALNIRSLAKRLQRIKTILYKNELIALEGSSATGDSTKILHSPILGVHMEGTEGNAPGADPAASAGIAGEQVFKYFVDIPAGAGGSQVIFPEYIRKRQERGELSLSSDEYVVLLDVLGAAGELLTFDQADNPFSVKDKTDSGFFLLVTSVFSEDVRVQYRICTRRAQDDIIQSTKALPVTTPSEFTNFTDADGTQYFDLNNAKSLRQNADQLSFQLDNFRNILRNGQNIPLMWLSIDWAFDEYSNFDGETPYLMIKNYGIGQEGFQIRPKIMHQRTNNITPSTKEVSLLSVKHDIDTDVAVEPGNLTRSHNFRIRFYFGVFNANGTQLDASRNYRNYDPGLQRLSPIPSYQDGPVVFVDNNKNLTPYGFGRGLFITEKIRMQPAFDGGSYTQDVWPPYTNPILFNSGCYSHQAGTGIEEMPDGTSQRYVDYLVWITRSYPANQNSVWGQDQYQTAGGVVWCQSNPIDVILMGRPIGPQFNPETEEIIPPPGNPVYNDNGIID